MKYDSTVLKTAAHRGQKRMPEFSLQLELEPRRRAFLNNISELIWPARQPSLYLSSRPGEFWPDVFVGSGLPWARFLQSGAAHFVIVTCALLAVHFTPRRTVIAKSSSAREDIIYYSPSEYLQQLDTGPQHAPSAKKGAPEYARQAIISVPSGADNKRQMVVTPPQVKSSTDLNLPNIVAWNPIQPAVPLAATERLSSKSRTLSLNPHVVAPPPEIAAEALRRASLFQPEVVPPTPQVQAGVGLHSLRAPQSAVVAPAPELDAELPHKRANIGLGQQRVVAPAPELEMARERAAVPLRARLESPAVVQPAPKVEAAFSRKTGLNLPRQQVVAPAPQLSGSALSQRRQGLNPSLNPKIAAVAPPPSLQGLHNQQADRQLIVLNVRPLAPAKTVAVPVGNRRGTFAATPEGKVGAKGTPDSSSAANHQSAGKQQTTAGIPSGIHVGASETSLQNHAAGSNQSNSGEAGNTAAKSPVLMANATPPRVSATRQPLATPASGASEIERQVFGGRKFYSMSLNLPNLNSASGSWVVHFAELKNDEFNGPQHNDAHKSDLIAPEAVHEVDPAYPLELMRENVHGTVVLYAVIRSDGSVAGIRVLQGVDDRLDQYACDALLRWHFLPALKNGAAVDLAAIFKIPFRPARAKSAF